MTYPTNARPAGRRNRRRRLDLRTRLWHMLSVAVAVILLVSAALKVHQLGTRPIIASNWLDQRWVLTVGIVFEIVLAMMLLARFAPRLTWGTALGTFVFFAGVSTWKGLRGEASCGCFGTIEVWPWYTVGLDLLIVGLLVVIHPRLKGPLHFDAGDPSLAATVGLALLISVPALWITGSYRPAPLEPPEEAPLNVAADAEFSWSPQPVEHYLGTPLPGDRYQTIIALRNDSRQALHIQDLFCECSCMEATLLTPAVIDPGQAALVKLDCEIPQQASDYRKRVLITASGQQMILTVVADVQAGGWQF